MISDDLKLKALQILHLVLDKCNKKNCGFCSIIECPNGDPNHYSKFNKICPSCNPQLEFICEECKINFKLIDYNGILLCNKCIKLIDYTKKWREND